MFECRTAFRNAIVAKKYTDCKKTVNFLITDVANDFFMCNYIGRRDSIITPTVNVV